MKPSVRKFLFALGTTAAALALCCALLVVVVDPFYHYHAPWLGLKAVLTEKEYQVVGTLRNFEYDAVLVGSSMIENNDNEWYDEAFSAVTVKAARSYGGIADLVWYLEEAFDSQEVTQVFFNLDPSSLILEAETTFESSGCPMYLYDDNPLTDVKYLFNKTVLFEKIPYMIAQSLSGSYDESLSYNWAEGKDFSEAGALSQYVRQAEAAQMLPADTYAENLADNLALLAEVIEAHPETQFRFFLPPYSMIWWDDAQRSGLTDAYLWCEEETARTLLQYDNVSFYDYQNETEIVTDLSYYMDTIHFSPDINEWVCRAMAAGECEVTAENLEETFALTAALVQEYEEGPIRELEEAGAFRYE